MKCKSNQFLFLCNETDRKRKTVIFALWKNENTKSFIHHFRISFRDDHANHLFIFRPQFYCFPTFERRTKSPNKQAKVSRHIQMIYADRFDENLCAEN